MVEHGPLLNIPKYFFFIPGVDKSLKHAK